MRVLVCGGRTYGRYELVEDVLQQWNISTIIEGGASGADQLANRYAGEHGIAVETFPAEWSKYGKSAGYIRNAQMLSEGKPELVVAFPGGKGTQNMIKLAEIAKVPVHVVHRS